MRYAKTSGSKPSAAHAAEGRWTLAEPVDRYRYSVTAPYTPARIASIMAAANSGDIEQLCLAGREMMERNWDVIGALSQRADALTGVAWNVTAPDVPGSGSAAAEALEKTLRAAGDRELCTFAELIGNMTDAVVMPFSASEIVWTPGGGIAGFVPVETHNFTLRNTMTPRLVTEDAPDGMELPPDKYIIHRFKRRPDPARSGLIRVLLWLHCFQNWPIKDLFSFIERFGMPFVVAKVDPKSYDEQGAVLRNLIRSFGPNGGGVFTQGTELQLLNAANTGSDNVYFKALEFCHNAIYTLLVGQLASSGDSSGMSNGSAQTAVRQDILEADARSVESTLQAWLIEPWMRFNFAPGTPAPRLHFAVEPPEDLAKLATTVATLYNAGLEPDPAEMSEKFGLKLTKRENALPNSAAFAADTQKKKPEPTLADALNEWLGPLADRAGELAGLDDDKLAAALKKGITAKPGPSAAFEALLAGDMEHAYAGTSHSTGR